MNWVVATPAEAIASLADDLANLDLHQGIENSLDSKLSSALSALDDVNLNNDAVALHALRAFMNQVDAQRGKKIDHEEADRLISQVELILESLQPELASVVP